MQKLTLSFAAWDYDRILPLVNGKVKIEGINLIYIPLYVTETIYRMMKNKEFDVAEMSLGGYIQSLASKDKPFIAIPVFPLRMFRHRSIYVNVNSVREVEDLKGKIVGVPEYRQTAAVWIKGIMEEYYGIPVNSVTYYMGKLERETWDLSKTDEVKLWRNDIKLIRIPEEKNLSEMLEKGEIDALYSAITPSCFLRGSKSVRRLFSNYYDEERRYFERTRIFPIMHIIVIKREVYEENPWVALSLYKAFLKAKRVAYHELREKTGTAVKYMLPWLDYYVDKTVKIMGEDFWPYGVKATYHEMMTFLKYIYNQGIIDKVFKPEEIFASETLEDPPLEEINY